MPSALPHPLRTRYVVLAAVLLGALLSGVASRWFLSRELVFEATFNHAPSPWNLQWTPASPAIPPNGRWLLLPQLGASPAGPTDPTLFSAARLRVVQPLPWYDVSRLRLAWSSPAPASVEVHDAHVLTRLCGYRVDRLNLPDPAAEPGGLLFLPPHHRWTDRVFGGLAMVVVLVGALIVVRVVAWLAACWSDWVDRPAIWARRGPRFLWRGSGVLSGVTGGVRFPARAMAWWPRNPPSRFFRISCFLLAALAPVWLMSWAPLIISSDGTAYFWVASDLASGRGLASFDGWRLPGYSLLLWALLWARDLALAISLTHAALAVGAALLAFALVRRRAPGWPAYLAMLAAALDPMVMLWQRLTQTETLSTFLVLLCAWLFVLIRDRLVRPLDSRRAWLGSVALTAALGLALGYASITRGNFQVLAVLLPLGLFVLPSPAPRLRRSLFAGALALVCGLASLGVIWPWVHQNQTQFHRTSLTVGPGFSRQLQGWQNGTIDWNQSGVMSYPQLLDMIERMKGGGFNEYTYSQVLLASRAAPADALPYLKRDVIGAVVCDESFARNGPAHARIAAKAMLSQLGWPIDEPFAFRHAVHGWLTGLIFNPLAEPITLPNFKLDFFPRPVRLVLQRVIRPLVDVTRSPNSVAAGLWFHAWELARPLIALGMLVGIVRLARQRDWAFAWLGLCYLAHAGALALLVFAGENRYSMPLYPLMAAVALVGLSPRASPSPKIANHEAARY
ncbi:MAG: hypothetical protein GC200_05345 [Tepidisphaera sp.]|nr:hypothetical protein [Tepidisphaera sp.]